MKILNPFTFRDVSRGIYRKTSVNSQLMPVNSVAHSINFNYDMIIGSAVVRTGTTKVGATIALNENALGLTEFINSGTSINLILSVYSGLISASLYYFDTIWHTSGLITLDKFAKVRFATLGGSSFLANGTMMRSSVDGNTWGTTNCITTDFVIPSLLCVAKNRMLATGPIHPSRIYFSSIVDLSASPFITWNTNATTGDWIDLNPDDGDDITGYSDTSALTLVFKRNALYRVAAISKTVDTNNIFNIGAVSQEAIVRCQGVTYFFSGLDIRRTNGDYPEQISRLGVQDLIDAIPQASWTSVAAGTDGLNVYFSIGNITLETGTDNQITYSNVVLKFSPRDESWSIHSYTDAYRFFFLHTFTTGRQMIGADTDGDVHKINLGQTDNGNPIYYDLQTQEIDFGSRATTKKITDKMAVFMNFGKNSEFQIRQDDDDYKPLKIDLSKRVNIQSDMNLEGHFFTFRVLGNSTGTSPIFEGFLLNSITDQGMIR